MPELDNQLGRTTGVVHYVARRLAWGVITMLLVASAVFVIYFVVPGGGGERRGDEISPVAVLIAGRQATPAGMRRIERELGLDKPVLVQYRNYITAVARGDLGFSYAFGAPVRDVVMQALPASVSIAFGASLLWLCGGLAIGVASVRNRGRWGDRLPSILALAGLSAPAFVIALLGLMFFYRVTGIYAGNRYVPLTQNPFEWLAAMWMPWICLAFPLIAVYARTVRSQLLEVGSEDYIRTARAKGLDHKGVLRHELRSGLTPIVTMFGLDFGLLLGGSVIIETIFRIPGLGALLLQARDFYDFPIMSGIVIVISAIVVLVNLIVDLAYAALDPRVRLGANSSPKHVLA